MDWGADIRREQDTFFSKTAKPAVGYHSASMGTERVGGSLFLRGYSGRSVKVTTVLHLV